MKSKTFKMAKFQGAALALIKLSHVYIYIYMYIYVYLHSQILKSQRKENSIPLFSPFSKQIPLHFPTDTGKEKRTY